jgi:hypothetical protein
MITSIDDWLLFLKQAHSAAGFPMVVGGVAFMFFGWRMWKLCVVLSFGLLGAVIGANISGPSADQWMYAACGAAVLGVLSYWPVNVSVSLLGGMIGSGIVTAAVAQLGLSGGTLWAAAGVGMIAFTAYSYLNRQYIVIIVTAFLGAILLMSGLTTWIMNLPGLYGTLRSMATGSVVVLPFMLMVPTIMSSFYQSAEIRRLNVTI